MVRTGKTPATAVAYGSALVAVTALIGGGIGIAAYLRTHLGAPPPIVVVAQGPAVSTTAAVPSSRTIAPTNSISVPPESIPYQVPDVQAYTGVPASAQPDFGHSLAGPYGWFGGDGVSARCDQWQRAAAVGETERILFAVCGGEFKGYDLRTATPIRVEVSSVQLSEGELTVTLAGGEVVSQPVIQWWMP
ncbi:hypothetical protein ACFXHA_11580 [Nocardia sp. NPDC059240]|uniref:hypothetical protein n=1 Tax=Nocardia sp. NPDC059240 TaxID=3346786 RepID=UPI0036B39A89